MTTSGLSDSFDSESKYTKIKASKTRKKYSYLIYNFLFFGFVSVPMLSVGLFNWIIDPYDIFNTPNYLGINHEKIKKDNNDRLFKAADIIRIKPKIILAGSSRTKQGLNPEHPVFEHQQSVYNLAINGPNFYEVRRYIEHAVANQPDLKEIVLGIDFFMFNNRLANQPSFSEQRLEKKQFIASDMINALFSLDTFDISRKTMDASQQTPDLNNYYGENGFMPNRNANDGKTDWRFEQSINLYFTLHSDYQFSDKYWSDFAQLVELCQQNNIELKVFISPAHATDLESIRLTQQWETFEQWKRKLVQLIPVWDFSCYNSVTTEAIAPTMSNYVDNSHYNPNIGNLILNRIFDYQTEQIPQDFGVLITTKNIEQHLEQIRSDRKRWANNHPDEIKLVEEIKSQLENSKLSK
ncbi:hypothetical protein Sta7437_2983 [Stanieria cyanosphaera PCC 7437]|uniref:Uncharacterized protein n=1 Tax=Stanieria cyanosphaera (strain ATCC 29371 / PCC 7437) TaxID=111780 RepID=K9XXX0_STAC7|nr:hypothetical protein [Stanieria cyanosphaera]AFZ36502.1 hypothetical protein Sta7437_2983 [Stanieria cyanosphaera PCC 7437]